MRRLIVNADDFGMTMGINRAIVEGCEQGIITSSTLMANSNAFDHAVAQAKDLLQSRPQFSIGCHIVLLDGTPVLPAERIPSLLGASNAPPEFRISIGSFARAALTGKLVAAEIEAEARAQFNRIQKAGIRTSHFDCHKHAHMFPAVLRPLLRAAREEGIAAIRNPFGAVFPLPVNQTVRNPKLWRRTAELGFLRNFAGKFRQEVESQGLRTTDGTVGVVVTGTLDRSSFVDLMKGLPQGTWEFVCHPGYNDAELDKVRTRLRQSRMVELALLTSPEVKTTLNDHAIELISYHQL